MHIEAQARRARASMCILYPNEEKIPFITEVPSLKRHSTDQINFSFNSLADYFYNKIFKEHQTMCIVIPAGE